MKCGSENCLAGGVAPGGSILYSAGANAGQTLRDARIQADDGGGKLVHRRDQSQPDRGYDQRVLHQILALLIPNEPNREFPQKFLHHFLSVAAAGELLVSSTEDGAPPETLPGPSLPDWALPDWAALD